MCGFESRLNPYPEQTFNHLHQGLFRFIWSNLEGMKKWIFLLCFLIVRIGGNGGSPFPIYGRFGGMAQSYDVQTLWVEKEALVGMLIFLLLF